MSLYRKAIFFDLDYTLISFDGASELAWDKCCDNFTRENFFNITKNELLDTIKKTRKWFWSDPVRHKIGRENIKNARREIVKKAFFELEINDLDLAFQFADNYSSCQNELICLFPNTLKTLCSLQKK